MSEESKKRRRQKEKESTAEDATAAVSNSAALVSDVHDGEARNGGHSMGGDEKERKKMRLH